MTPGSRPEIGSRPNFPDNGFRPGIGDRPNFGNGNFGGDRPGIANRPNFPGMENRPGINNRPGNDFPGWNNRPGVGEGRFPNHGEWANNLQDRLQNRPGWDNHPWNGNHPYPPHPPYNPYWNHGYWHGGYWGNRWNYMWNNYPVAAAFGVTAWGLNAASYAFGCGSYSNPYYTQPVVVDDSTSINYSEPLVSYSDSDQAPQVPPQSSDAFDQARTDFYNGDYQSALKNVNKALAAMPKDASVNEFRALVLFALGQYREAAETIYAVLSVGPGWDWTTLSSLYPNVDVYTEQLRKLEEHCRTNPDDAAARFLLAYHYITCGHNEAAVKQLKLVLQLQPNNSLAAQLVKMLSPQDAGSSDPNAQPPAPPTEKPVPPDQLITADKLVGKWTAKGQGDSTFVLEMTADKQFTWSFTTGGKTQSIKGVFAIDNNNLALEPPNGGTMLGTLTKKGSNGFHFAMVGAPEGDPGLDFTRSS